VVTSEVHILVCYFLLNDTKIGLQRDQVQLEQKEIDELRLQVDICRREVAEERRIMEQTEVCLEEKVSRFNLIT